MSELPDMKLRLGKKTKKTGIGMSKDPDAPRKPMKFSSKKQTARTNALKEKLNIVLDAQESLYGIQGCEASRGHKDWKFRCPGLDGRYLTLVLDHVETRNGWNADRYENLQVLCSWCNHQKGSIRGLDFRPAIMIQSMRELDNRERKNEIKDR
jgi:hypothetical protein